MLRRCARFSPTNSMTLNDLPSGALVYIDANIFVYHFSGVSLECRTLFKRIEREDIRAATGAHIVLEVLHRLMMIEAISKSLITPGTTCEETQKESRRHHEAK